MGKIKDSNYFQNRVKDLTKGEYDVLSKYVSSSTKVEVRHNKCGLTYSVTPNNFLKGRRCPYCAGRKVKADVNSLSAKWPQDLAKEWDYEKNKFSPDEVSSHSSKKAWWKCRKNHSWRASINSRMSGVKCPYCFQEGRQIYKVNQNENINKILNDLGLKGVYDKRFKECKITRPLSFSVAVYNKENILIALIDYRKKYYPREFLQTKKKFCKDNNIPFLFITLNYQSEDSVLKNDDLEKIKEWIKTTINEGGAG